MSLSRKFLAALGIEQEKIDEIIDAHTETVNALKEERDKYRKDAEALPEVQKELDELKQAAEKNPDDVYKQQYEDLKSEYEQYKADVDAKETAAKKREAYKSLLKQVGVSEKRLDAILKVSQYDGVELEKDGTIKGANDIMKSLKEEWADFIVQEETKGAETKTPPAGTGAGSVKTLSRAAQVAAKHNEMIYGVKGDKGE